MNFDIKLDFKNGSSAASKQVGKVVAQLWQKIHTTIFLVFLTALLLLGGYVWQQSLHGTGWSNAKKQEYLNTQNKTVIFKENDFKKVADDVQSRKDASASLYEPIKDIFKPY